MIIQIIHLSDMHFSDKSQALGIDVEKMIRAIGTKEDADECVIVISGDLTNSGKPEEYKCVNSLVGAILKNLEMKKYNGKKIEIICVPGNHDINFANIRIGFGDIQEAYKRGKISDIINNYIDNMSGFYDFAHHRECFQENRLVSKKVIKYSHKSIGFVMFNTAPLSLLGGNAEDMGNHFVSDEELDIIEQATEGDINVLVMHHSIEWFQTHCKDRLRKIISKRYSLVITGHEHLFVGESRNINGAGEVQCVQGNALYGVAENGNGFCSINIDIKNNHMIGYSYLWNKDIYIPSKILDGEIKICFNGRINIKKDFVDELSYDTNKRKIDEYYIFPGLAYNCVSEDDKIERHDIETEDELFGLIEKYNKILIKGEHKSGKSVLAQKLYREFLIKGKYPLLICADDIIKKKIEKTVEISFSEQYEIDNNAYERFMQMDIDDKVVLLDEANLIQKQAFEKLIIYLEKNFRKVIILSEEKFELSIRKQVIDTMVDDALQISIKPFLYAKRKKLITNVLTCNEHKVNDIEKEAVKINDLINMQVKYFSLNPEFIINFVNQYERDFKFQFFSGMNVFNIVYESSIRNKIIASSENVDATLVTNLLRELAYYMHFEKKNIASMQEVDIVVDTYKKEYRQKISTRNFLEVALNSKILMENEDGIRFRDHTIVAYFVAQALNQKNNQGENIQGCCEILLKNLCFSINSDIIMFLALITNNPKFLYLIMNGAKQHFANQEELSFDKQNVKFIMNTSVPVKENAPSKKEKQLREEELSKQEEKVRFSDLIELVNEYNYSEEDLNKIENQVMISLKYLEILSKMIPAFCQNMKVKQQDELVSLIYHCPNQFLYMILKDIANDFEGFCNELYEEVSSLRREKNISDVDFSSVKYVIEQIAAILVIMIYQMSTSTCTTEQSITALNAFYYQENSNYKLQNLMMQARDGDINAFSKRAKELDKEMKNKIEKSIIKYTVRDYFLRNNVEIYGEAQSLLDHFFGKGSKDGLKMDIARRRITDKDRI